MIWYSSILSTVSSDTEPTVVINFDSGKYVFNAGENTVRAYTESNGSWRNTKALFMTGVGTQRNSGLPGLCMSLADAYIKKLDIVGPPGLMHQLATMRTYLYRNGMQVTTSEVDARQSTTLPEPQAIFQDQNLTVYGILLPTYVHETKQTEEEMTLLTGDADIYADQRLWPKRRRTPSPDTFAKRRRYLHNSTPNRALADNRTMVQRSHNSDFVPLYLHGAEAKQWRSHILDSMFPYIHVPPVRAPAQRTQGKGKKGKGKDQPAEVVMPEAVEPTPPPTKPVVHGRARGRRLPSALDLAPPPRCCYVCVGPKVRGKFDVEKAKALGIPKGRIRADLTSGQTVTFEVDDGKGGKLERTVRPEEVVSASEIPKVCIIVDVASPDQIPELVSHFTESPFYRQFRSKDEKDAEQYFVSAVVHLCGDEVLEDPLYKEFMNGFSETTNHVVSSRKYLSDPVSFGNAALAQCKLNQLDAQMFPMQHFRVEPERQLSEVAGLPKNTFAMVKNLRIGIRPSHPPVVEKPDKEERYKTINDAVYGPGIELPAATLEAYAKARSRHALIEADAQNAKPTPGDDVVVVPLGTSSALPNRYRNVSSTLIQIPRWGSILLDAGEGTWGQLARFFGDDPARVEGVWQFLRELKCIFLSHIHGDHHIGVTKILAMRKMLDPPPSDPLYVIGLRHHLLYLREMSDIEDFALDAPGGRGVITIMSDALSFQSPKLYPDPDTMELEPWTDCDASQMAAEDMCRLLGLNRFTTVEMDHGTRCYGAVIKHSDGWSIAFSADTVPTDRLVNAGQNATLLIHEASMADDQLEVANAKLHSTFSQAVDVGLRMNAQSILLTHFSARYPKMPQSEAVPIVRPNVDQTNEGAPGGASSTTPGEASSSVAEEAASSRTPPVGLAFDHMRIRLGDMRKLKTYLPAIQQSFEDTIEAEDEEPDPAKAPW